MHLVSLITSGLLLVLVAPQLICLDSIMLFRSPQAPSSGADVDGCSTASHQQMAARIPPAVQLTTVPWGFSGLLWQRGLHSFSGTLPSFFPALSPYLCWHGAKNICGIPKLTPHGWQTPVANESHSSTPPSHPPGCTVLRPLAVVFLWEMECSPHCLQFISYSKNLWAQSHSHCGFVLIALICCHVSYISPRCDSDFLSGQTGLSYPVLNTVFFFVLYDHFCLLVFSSLRFILFVRSRSTGRGRNRSQFTQIWLKSAWTVFIMRRFISHLGVKQIRYTCIKRYLVE